MQPSSPSRNVGFLNLPDLTEGNDCRFIRRPNSKGVRNLEREQIHQDLPLFDPAGKSLLSA